MDEVVSELVSYKTVILMVAVVIVTFFIRRIVETAMPALKSVQVNGDSMAHVEGFTSHFAVWWNQVLLHLLPVVIGAGMAASGQDLISIKGITSTMGMVVYGGITGWFSATGYRILLKTIKTKTGATSLPTTTNRPPPPDNISDSLSDSEPTPVVNGVPPKSTDTTPPQDAA